MMGWLTKLRPLLPRRRRLWRYVSGRRHGFGIAVFVLLVLIIFAYWQFTDDARVQRHVKQYLEDLTGGQVKLDEARFSIFAEIRVRNLRLYLDRKRDGQQPFFVAEEVIIHHRPSELILKGRLSPTEIICVGPRVSLLHDRGGWAAQQIFPIAGHAPVLKVRELPPIRLRRGTLEVVDLDEGELTPVKWQVPLTVTLLPGKDGRTYNLTFEEQLGADSAIGGTGTIDISTGSTHITGWAGLAGLDQALPQRYRMWRERHKLCGKVTWEGDARIGVGGGGPGQFERLTARLEDVSMELPREEGGLRLGHVNGVLVFGPSGIEVKELTGKLVDLAGTAFGISGRYEGYEDESPYRMEFVAKGLTLPLEDEAAALGQAMGGLLEQLQAKGSLDVRATIQRSAQGFVRVDSRVALHDISARLPYWPLRLEGLTGEIVVGGPRVELRGIRGRHGSATISLDGWLEAPFQTPPCDLKVEVRNLPLTEEVRLACIPATREAWDALRPQGQVDADVRIACPRTEPGQPGVTVQIKVDGRASAEWRGFPYRVEGLTGEVVVGPDNVVRTGSLRGQSGPMRCEVKGFVDLSGRETLYDLRVNMTGMALDRRLADALPKEVRAPYDACGIAGVADVAEARFWQEQGGSFECEIPAVLKDVELRHQEFPYAIRRAAGKVTIRPGKVHIEHLVGEHGQARLNLSGTVALKSVIQDADLTIDAANLPLDQELYAALPPGARQTWDSLEPAGAADVTLKLRSGRGAAATNPAAAARDEPDYELTVRPREARFRYSRFPYPMRGVTGTLQILPGQARLENLTGYAGKSRVTLDGRIFTADGKEAADLAMTTEPLEIDRVLLAALPPGLAESLKLEAGGTVELALKNLQIRPLAATQPAVAAPGAPGPAATQPSTTSAPAGGLQSWERLAWGWTGRIVFKDANMALGLEAKRFTGWIDGEMSCAGPAENLKTSAQVWLSNLGLGTRQMSEFGGTLQKDERSPVLKIERISGQAYGGRIAGFLHVRLADPVRYGLNLSVENIDLSELLNAGVTDPKRKLDIQGLLTGSLQMTAEPARPAARQCTGKLSITRAKLYRLPVLLDFVSVISLSLPSDKAFTTADVDYDVLGDELTFRDIYLESPALSMVGAGKLNLKTEKLDITFVSGPPRKLPRIGALRDVLQDIAGELMAVRVTGTLQNPHVQTISLRTLDEGLRDLLRPPK